ncbi:MAG: alpha/beta hydrolase-fold protein [Myxococcota bacterium]
MIPILSLALMALASPTAPGTEVGTATSLGSRIARAEKDGIRFSTFANGFSVELIGGEAVQAFTCCDLQIKFELSTQPTYVYAEGFRELRAPFVIFRNGETTRFDLNGASFNPKLEANKLQIGQHTVHIWASGPNGPKTRCLGIVKMDGAGWAYYAHAAAQFIGEHPEIRVIIAGVSGNKKNRRIEYGLGAGGGHSLFLRTEQLVTEDTPPLLRKQCASGRLVLGLAGESMGASFALSVGARHPGVFDYVGAASPTWLEALASVEPVSGRKQSVLLISAGEYEGEKEQQAVDTFKRQAKAHYSKVIEKTFLGGHGFGAWGSAFDALLRLMNGAE